jgi:hypothetical protein
VGGGFVCGFDRGGCGGFGSGGGGAVQLYWQNSSCTTVCCVHRYCGGNLNWYIKFCRGGMELNDNIKYMDLQANNTILLCNSFITNFCHQAIITQNLKQFTYIK